MRAGFGKSAKDREGQRLSIVTQCSSSPAATTTAGSPETQSMSPQLKLPLQIQLPHEEPAQSEIIFPRSPPSSSKSRWLVRLVDLVETSSLASNSRWRRITAKPQTLDSICGHEQQVSFSWQTRSFKAASATTKIQVKIRRPEQCNSIFTRPTP